MRSQMRSRNELLAFLSYTSLNIGLTGECGDGCDSGCYFVSHLSCQLLVLLVVDLARSASPIGEFHGIDAHWRAGSSGRPRT